MVYMIITWIKKNGRKHLTLIAPNASFQMMASGKNGNNYMTQSECTYYQRVLIIDKISSSLRKRRGSKAALHWHTHINFQV